VLFGTAEDLAALVAVSSSQEIKLLSRTQPSQETQLRAEQVGLAVMHKVKERRAQAHMAVMGVLLATQGEMEALALAEEAVVMLTTIWRRWWWWRS
jgi:hypothetical protein